MSQDYGKIWEASLVYGLFIGIQLVRIFSSMLQKGEVNLEKSAITLKYAMDAERIFSMSMHHNADDEGRLPGVVDEESLLVIISRYKCIFHSSI